MAYNSSWIISLLFRHIIGLGWSQGLSSVRWAIDSSCRTSTSKCQRISHHGTDEWGRPNIVNAVSQKFWIVSPFLLGGFTMEGIENIATQLSSSTAPSADFTSHVTIFKRIYSTTLQVHQQPRPSDGFCDLSERRTTGTTYQNGRLSLSERCSEGCASWGVRKETISHHNQRGDRLLQSAHLSWPRTQVLSPFSPPHLTYRVANFRDPGVCFWLFPPGNVHRPSSFPGLRAQLLHR